ncbi:MAG TPA: transposase [Tahibacter sp.]|nr:transposase [Tahibacter sp.]
MHIVDAQVAGTYHVVSRCVRRAWLCGRDPLTGSDFSHRKRWIEERIIALAEQFAVAIYAYAVMSNHVHLVVRTDPEAPKHWDAQTVLRRWFAVSPRKHDTAETLQQRIDTSAGNETRIAEYRSRLGSLSWFMRALNESIARAANAEDRCKGRFWEGRFRCQALLDDAAVLSAMTYVDLNPVRARMVETPEAAESVSFRRRFDTNERAGTSDRPLLPIAGNGPACNVSEVEYLKLVDETGRMIRNDKPGSIDRSLPTIARRLGLSESAWLAQVQGTQSRYWRVIGHVESFLDKAAELQQRWLQGLAFARRLRATLNPA